jgi:hypothetical protein
MRFIILCIGYVWKYVVVFPSITHMLHGSCIAHRLDPYTVRPLHTETDAVSRG